MTAPASKPPLGLQRTDVSGFLRTVDTKLRAAVDFLNRGAPWPGLPAPNAHIAAAPLLIAAPPPRLQPLAATVADLGSPAGSQPQTAEAGLEGLDWGSCEAADAGHVAGNSLCSQSDGNISEDAEVAGLLPMPRPGGTTAAPTTAHAVEESRQRPGQPERENSGEKDPDAWTAPVAAAEAGVGAMVGLPGAAQHEQRHRQQRQQQHEQQRQRHGSAKVLSWLDNSDACEPHMDAIPAVHTARRSEAFAAAPAGRPLMPGKHAAASGTGRAQSAQPLRPAQPRTRPLSAGRPSRPPQPPAGSWDQLAHSDWVPPKLTLARPSCATCDRAETDCRCTSAAAPLRLLRPRQPGCSPLRSLQCQRLQQTAKQGKDSTGQAAPLVSRQQQQALMHAPQALPPPGRPQAPGAINIASIQTAYFASNGQPEAAWQAQAPLAAAATTVALAPAQQHGWGGSAAAGAAEAAGPSRCAELARPAAADGAGLDLWAAYLASRAPAAAGAALQQQPGREEGGAVGQLRSISQRIRGMQGHISSFLLQQHQPPASPVQPQAPLSSAAAGCMAPAGAATRAGSQAAPGALGPLAAGGSRTTASGEGSRPAQGLISGMAADPFTDDAILSILTGTDFARRERAAVAAAGGAPASGDKQSAGGGAAGAAAARAGAVQRLKEVQQRAAVQAVRVGRQERGVQRTPLAS